MSPVILFFGSVFVDLLIRLYNNILPPSSLPQKANYYLFKARYSSATLHTTSESLSLGRDHSRLGRRSQQIRWQMEHPVA